MSQLEKLLEKIKNNPRQVRFAELDKLTRAGFNRRQPGGGSSHYIYTKGVDSTLWLCHLTNRTSRLYTLKER